MVPRIRWHESWEEENPFVTDKPLRLTLHNSSLNNLSREDAEALAALQELSYLPQIKILQTEPGEHPHVEILLDQYDMIEEHYPLRIRHEGNTLFWGGVHFPRNPDLCLVSYTDGGMRDVDTQPILADLLVASAHSRLRQHILVTASPYLLNHLDYWRVEDANPRTPVETARIVGLLLRHKRISTISRFGGVNVTVSRHQFYWALTRSRLHSMWRCTSACVEAYKLGQHKDFLDYSLSILERASRALETRDYIGQGFYSPQDWDNAHKVLYHFDYLNLLVAGAFDVLCLLIYYSYRLTKPKAKYVGFKNEKFIEELKKLPNTTPIVALIEGPSANVIRKVVFEFRNTIHKIPLHGVTVSNSDPIDDMNLIRIPQNHEEAVRETLEKHSSLEKWGIYTTPSELNIEAYTYATTLIDESFNLINAMVSAMSFDGLFPDGTQIQVLRTTPPTDDELFQRFAYRMNVLG